MIGVADGGINSFAFKTRQSIVPRQSEDAFYHFWDRGGRYPSNPDVTIANQFKLALHKGGINQPLKRIV